MYPLLIFNYLVTKMFVGILDNCLIDQFRLYIFSKSAHTYPPSYP
jgi:hypothetical protein